MRAILIFSRLSASMFVPAPVLGFTPDPIDAIYRAHHGWLLSWFRRRLGGASRAADLAHDRFVRLIVASGAHAISEPRAFLRTLAHGVLVNHWRRQDIEWAWRDALSVLPKQSAPSPEERLLVLETLCRIDAMLDRFNPKARTAFLRSQLDGLTYAEITAQLGVLERRCDLPIRRPEGLVRERDLAPVDATLVSAKPSRDVWPARPPDNRPGCRRCRVDRGAGVNNN